MNYIKIFVAGMILLFFTGCFGEKRPEGFPKLYPLSIEIVQEGTPLVGAGVALVSDDANLSRWPSGGVTDEKGIVQIHTYQYPGAPEGSFKVTVTKTLTEGAQSDILATGKGNTQKVYELVDSKYSVADKTPLTIEVKAGTTPVSKLDVGKKVKTFISAP